MYDEATDTCFSGHIKQEGGYDLQDAKESCLNTVFNTQPFFPRDLGTDQQSKTMMDFLKGYYSEMNSGQEPTELKLFDGRYALNSRGKRAFLDDGSLAPSGQNEIAISTPEDRMKRCTLVTVK